MLRVKYDWGGEGKFWALNNIIANSNECKLDISRKFIVADILELFQMNREDFEEFVNYLVEDCELLERDGDIITTEIVQENYGTIKKSRLKNKENYTKRVEKDVSTVKNEIQPIETEIKPIDQIQSKVNESEVNKSKLNKIKVEEITSSIYFEKCKELFKNHTRISDPNIKTHVAPIIFLHEKIPENLTQKDVENCIEETFKTLDKNTGINMEFLTQNISRAITRKHEAVLEKDKQKVLNEAKNERIKAEKLENEQLRNEALRKLGEYKNFYNENHDLFSAKEKYDLAQFFKKNQVLNAGKIIESKMEEIEL